MDMSIPLDDACRASQALYGVEDFDIESCQEEVKRVLEKNETTTTDSECENVSGFIAAHSSLLLTHCFLVVIERLSAGYLSLGVKVRSAVLHVSIRVTHPSAFRIRVRK